MGFTIKDFAGFEGSTDSLLTSIEGESHGSAASISSAVAPYPDDESQMLRLLQNGSGDNIWVGKSYTVAEGDILKGSVYVYFYSLAEEWQPTFDLQFFSLVSGSAIHFRLNLYDSGDTYASIAVIDGSGYQVEQLTDVVAPNTKYRIDWKCELRAGTAGRFRMRIMQPASPGGVQEMDLVTGQDFYAGTSSKAIMEGEDDVPVAILYTYIGSYMYGEDATSVSDDQDFDDIPYLGDFTIIGGVTDEATARPHCTANGTAVTDGTYDLDVNEWDETAGDGATYAQYNMGTYGEGAVTVEHPAGDSRMNTSVVQFGGEWCMMQKQDAMGRGVSGGWDMVCGHRNSDDSFTVATAARSLSTTLKSYKVVLADGQSALPDLTPALDRAVIGFRNGAFGAGPWYNQSHSQVYAAAYFGCYEYPFPETSVREAIKGGTGCALAVGRDSRMAL